MQRRPAIAAHGDLEVKSPDGDRIRLSLSHLSARADFASWRSLRRARGRFSVLSGQWGMRARGWMPTGWTLEISVRGRVVASGREGGGTVSWHPRWTGILSSAIVGRA